MFKVLVIAYYYPPMGLSGVQRTLKFTKYMKRFDWEPTVITAGDIAYYAHDLGLLKEAEEAGVKIIRTESFDLNSVIGKKYGTINMPKEYLRKLFSKFTKTFFIPDNKKSWAKRAYHIAQEILKKESFDIIFATPPCTEYSTAKTTKVRDMTIADALVEHTLKIIKYFQPKIFHYLTPTVMKNKTTLVSKI